jgi:hypothetical protein
MEERKIKNRKFFSLPAKTIFSIVLFLFIGLSFAGNFASAQNTLNGISPTGGNAVGTAPAQLPAGTSATCGAFDIICQLPILLSKFVAGLTNIVAGRVLILLMAGVMSVAQYSNLTTAVPVTTGWVIVRDLCNMFFILVLLLIAFATILRVEGYDIKKMVPKLIIMAILINFSKTICGLIIDFAQIIMNAFLSPVAGVSAMSLTAMFGLDGLMKFNPNPPAADAWTILGAYVMAFIYSAIAAVVMLVIFVVLIVRVVMIWIYVVLSPLPYLFSTFPQGKKYVDQWWSEFTKNVIVGPVLAFFLWLSLVSLGSGNNILPSNITDVPSNGLTVGMSFDQLIKFAISIGMLIGGLMVTQQMGGYMGSIAGKGMAKIQGGVNVVRKGITGGLSNLAAGQIAGEGFVGKNVRAGLTGLSRQGGVMQAVGVSGLATRGLIAVEQKKKSYKDNAEKFVGNVRDRETAARYANSHPKTAGGMAIKDAFINKAPDLITNDNDLRSKVREADKDKVSKWSDRSWTELGSRGIALDEGSRARSTVEKDADALGAYNYGVAMRYQGANPNSNVIDRTTGRINTAEFMQLHASGQIQAVLGKGRNDNPKNPAIDRTAFGNLPGYIPPPMRGQAQTPITVSDDRVHELRGDTDKYRHRYRAVEGDWDKARGAGNLSVDSFSRGASNVVAADFDKLGLDSLRGDYQRNSQVKGVHTEDRAEIADIAKKMVTVIDSEMSRLKTGPQTAATAGRLADLQAARTKFSEPQKIDKLDLVNSSSSGYSGRDLQRTIIHEEIHSHGVGSEADTEKLAQYAVDSKQRSKVADMAKELAAGGNVDEIVSRQKGAAPAPRKNLDEVFAAEREADPVEIIREESASGGAAVETPTFKPSGDTEKVVNNISSGKNSITKASMLGLINSIKQLAASIRRNTKTMGKRDQALADLANIKDDAPPLVVSASAEKISENFQSEA